MSQRASPSDATKDDEDEDSWKKNRPSVTTSDVAKRFPHIGLDGVLMYSDDDNDSTSKLGAIESRVRSPKKRADKRVRTRHFYACAYLLARER